MPKTESQESNPNYVKGLEGIVASETALSLVDGAAAQLSYRGIHIDALAQKSCFEETIYLLWDGKLPKKQEFEAFKKRLASFRKAPKEVLDLIQAYPKNAHPMAALRSAVSSLALYDANSQNVDLESTKEHAYRLTAVVPTLIAAFYRRTQGEKPVEPKADLSHAANFLYMMHGKEPSSEMERALDAYLILLADHGLNASTFSARVTTSTDADTYSGVTSAIGTLKGDLHGSANQRAMEMILEIGELENAEKYVMDAFANKKKIMGFGHRIYKKQDPRAVVFRAIARKMCEQSGKTKWMDISDATEKVVWREKQIPCNVDFYSASVLYVLGFPVDFFTTVFAASRVAGWTAHIVEQRADNRLIRPKAQYVGPRDQAYTPLEKR